MKYSGKIKNLNHIVISDPTYEKDVWCRYEIDNLKEKNWHVDLDIYEVEEKIGDYNITGIEFCMVLQKIKGLCKVEDDKIKYLSGLETKDYEIGMDTACVALGINDKAKRIINSQAEWQPSCSIRTGTDGMFGSVTEGKKNNDLVFLVITGYLSSDMDYDIDDLTNYLIDKFEITDLVKEIIIDKDRELKKGDKVEISFCHITNDVGGSTMIKTKDYVDEIDGMKLTIHEADGTVDESVIHTNYPCVDLPIEVEIISGAYDYETGFNYKGKIINEKLIDEFRKIGTTGRKLEDYKEFENKPIYDDVKQASENYDPSIVYFSEFDVIKKLEKDSNLEVGG